MTNQELIDNKINIVMSALLDGAPIQIDTNLYLVFSGGVLFEFYYEVIERRKARQSKMSLNRFLKYLSRLEVERLKNIYADWKLSNLQKKLIKRAKNAVEFDPNSFENCK